jgi:hypothetical protein
MFKDEMITAGAEKINNTNEECVPPFAIQLINPDLCNGSLMINDDIDAMWRGVLEAR